MTLRIRPEIKAALEQRAAKSGRSLSGESEALLEQALLSGEGILDQALDLAFGRQSAGLLLVVGRLLRDISLVADLASGRMPGATGGWVSEPFTCEQVKLGINQALDVLRPEGEAVEPLDEQYSNPSEGITNAILLTIAGHGITGDLKSWGEKIRERLGPEVVERIRSRGYEPPEGADHG